MKQLVKFVLFLALLAAAFVAGGMFSTRDVRAAASPDGSHVAFATDRRCTTGPCETLWVGTERRSAAKVDTLEGGTVRCDEIIWTRDGSRVAFLIDGYRLQLYKADGTPAGQLSLIQPQTGDAARIVRGVTFSENGRAITYDDCPRNKSGCRAGIAALPQ